MPPSQGCFCSRPAGGLQSSELIPGLTVQRAAGEQRLLTIAAQSFFFSFVSLLAGVDAEYAFLDLRHVGILFPPPCVLSFFQTYSDPDMWQQTAFLEGTGCPGYGGPGSLVTYRIEQCTVVSRWWIVVLLKNITHPLNTEGKKAFAAAKLWRLK